MKTMVRIEPERTNQTPTAIASLLVPEGCRERRLWMVVCMEPDDKGGAGRLA